MDCERLGPQVSGLFPDDPSVRAFELSLPKLTADERKSIVTLCRAQKVPQLQEARILAYQSFGTHLGTMLHNSPLTNAVRLVKKYIESPIYAGLILDMARACTPSTQEIQEMNSASFHKELTACNSDRRPSSLNYRSIFSGSHFDEAFVPGVRPRPEVNRYIHNILREWLDRCQLHGVHYPRISSKASSHWTRSECDQIWPKWRDEPIVRDDQFTQKIIEKLYAETGIEVSGPCEMRQRLYRAGIKPRTYFAQGGDSYRTSKYCQVPCTILVDLLPTSNHQLRLIPTNLHLEHKLQHLFIYDLKSFTSLFHEFLPFIRELAAFSGGTELILWDGRRGLVEKDMGELWDEYADTNAANPAYYTKRKGYEEQVFYHMVAGFLGVYGNLMLCTFLHAVVVLSVVGDAGKCYTAGDDGGAVLYALLVLIWEKRGQPPKTGNHPYDDVYVLFYALSLLGIIEWSKVFTTQEEGAIALKRPISQVEGHLISPSMVIWPQSILVRMYMNWSVPANHDPRFHSYYMFNSRKDCKSAIISECNRFMSHVASFSHAFSDLDLQRVHMYVVRIYQQLNIPRGGYVPQFSGSPGAVDDFVADVDGRGELKVLREDPYRRTILRHFPGWADVPIRSGGMSNHKEEDSKFEIGASWVGKKGRDVAYLCKLGYIEDRKLFERLEGSEALNRVLLEYDNSLLPPNIYEFKVLSLPPVMQS